jgi:hypothetical protein
MTKTDHPNVYAPLPRARAKPPTPESVNTRLSALRLWPDAVRGRAIGGSVKLYKVHETATVLYLVMELLTGGELFDRIVAKGHYSEDDARKLTVTMLKAVLCLHALTLTLTRTLALAPALTLTLTPALTLTPTRNSNPDPRCSTCTRWASRTATSSRKTCCSRTPPTRPSSRSPTSASPRSSLITRRHAAHPHSTPRAPVQPHTPSLCCVMGRVAFHTPSLHPTSAHACTCICMCIYRDLAGRAPHEDGVRYPGLRRPRGTRQGDLLVAGKRLRSRAAPARAPKRPGGRWVTGEARGRIRWRRMAGLATSRAASRATSHPHARHPPPPAPWPG